HRDVPHDIARLVEELTALVPSLLDSSRRLPELLRAQLAEAEESPYRLLSGRQPPLSMVYVEQRAEAGSAAADRDEADGASTGGGPVARPVDQLLRTARHAVVVGEPGAGKSTLLRHLVGLSAQWWLQWLSQPAAADVDAAPCSRAVPVWVPAS